MSTIEKVKNSPPVVIYKEGIKACFEAAAYLYYVAKKGHQRWKTISPDARRIISPTISKILYG